MESPNSSRISRNGSIPCRSWFSGDVLAAGFLSDRIEGPDLHRVDSGFGQIARQSARAPSENRYGRSRCCKCGSTRATRHRATGTPACRHLAGQVPERDIHGADGAHLRPRPAAERDRLKHVRPQPVDRDGSRPINTGARARWMIADSASGCGYVSPSPTSPASVWIRTHSHWIGPACTVTPRGR